MSNMPDWTEKDLDYLIKEHIRLGAELNNANIENAILRRDIKLMQERQKLKPIETAPRDRRFIAINYETQVVSDCSYIQEVGDFVMGDGHIGFDPTHWTELPEVPNE